MVLTFAVPVSELSSLETGLIVGASGARLLITFVLFDSEILPASSSEVTVILSPPLSSRSFGRSTEYAPSSLAFALTVSPLGNFT